MSKTRWECKIGGELEKSMEILVGAVAMKHLDMDYMVQSGETKKRVRKWYLNHILQAHVLAIKTEMDKIREAEMVVQDDKSEAALPEVEERDEETAR